MKNCFFSVKKVNTRVGLPGEVNGTRVKVYKLEPVNNGLKELDTYTGIYRFFQCDKLYASKRL